MGTSIYKSSAGLTAIALLAACAGNSDQYPSLAIRDAERLTGQSNTNAPTPPVPLSAEASSQIDEAVAQAWQTQQLFLENQAETLLLARSANGSSQDSDIRARALVAIARLSALRGQTSIALGRVDQIEAEAANSFADIEKVKQAQLEISKIIEAQDIAIQLANRELQP